MNQYSIPVKDKYLQSLYERHRRGAYVRSVASILMWSSSAVAYWLGFIHADNFISNSHAVLYLVLMNPPVLWVLKRIKNRSQAEYFRIIIHLLEIIGYTAVIHAFGGIEATFLLPIYAALITYVGITETKRIPFIVAVLSCICFSGMLALEYVGVLPTLKINPDYYVSWQNQIAIVFIEVILLSIVAFIASYTAQLLKINRDTLRRQNEELQQVAKEARESDRLKSEFLANMSHELRTPLNAIIGFSELLEDQFQEKLDKSQKEYVQDINKSGKHLLSIITDLLDLSKIEADKMVLKLTYVHLPMLLDNSLSMFKENVLKHRIRLSADVRGCPETIKADELRLRQVVYNILSNAVKFTPDGGVVILSARELTRSSDHWLTKNGEAVSLPACVGNERIPYERIVDIAVTDTGIGIKKEDLTRIFKPFEQADGSSSRQYQGTGLGLSLAKRFAELHGGHLCVESEGEQKGSTFHCVIPA